MAFDFLNVSDVDVKNNLSAINSWLVGGGILNDHVLNNLILFVMSFDKKVEDVEMYVSKDKNEFSFIIYLSRWNLFWHAKEIYRKLKNILPQYLINKTVKINFDIFKNQDKENE